MQIQVRDVALAAAIKLRGLDFADFGFEDMGGTTLYPFNPSNAGFFSEADREQAFSRWKDAVVGDESTLPASN